MGPPSRHGHHPPAHGRQIRKFALQAHSLDELVALGTILAQAARFLEAAVASGLNVLVSGGTQGREDHAAQMPPRLRIGEASG
jgi:type IV secretory pathway ATPase VirB11/archaellum biosynthesis ATPase